MDLHGANVWFSEGLRIPNSIQHFLDRCTQLKAITMEFTHVSKGIFTRPFLSSVPQWCVLVFTVELSPSKGKKIAYESDEKVKNNYILSKWMFIYL